MCIYQILHYVLEQLIWASNPDLSNIFTPVNVSNLESLLKEVQYDPEKTKKLTNGFKRGFDLGYRGSKHVKLSSPNLKFVVGSKTELWNKVLKEVQEKRYAGPFEQVPFDHYIQSPIGLVPKDHGKKTRLIFHLSYPRGSGLSVNENTPDSLTKVSYPDLDHAVQLCLAEGQGCHLGKSDFTSAFRHLPIAKKFWCYLVMKAQHPLTNQWFYFVDKCLPFGASISCALFQAFSDAIAFILKKKSGKDNVNYLDDFLFAAFFKYLCDGQIDLFLTVCKSINFPVSLDKTFWGCTRMVFLGILLDTVHQLVCLPTDKILKAHQLIDRILTKRTKKNKKSRKIKVKELQEICGFLNFLSKCVIPGRVFTRRLYAAEKKYVTDKQMTENLHINLTADMRLDLKLWKTFLEHPSSFNRKFFDFSKELTSIEVEFFTDASKNPELGAGGVCGQSWYILQWDAVFIKKKDPSINYLELYAVTIGVLLWLNRFQNMNITIFCDNMSVVHMLNNTSSKCPNCMALLRMIVLQCLKNNVRLTAAHVSSVRNTYADHLSRLKYNDFRRHARKMRHKFNNKPDPIPEILWPMENVWLRANKNQSNTKSHHP